MYIFYNSKSREAGTVVYKEFQARCKGVGPRDTFTTPEGKRLIYAGNELTFFPTHET